MPHRPFSSTNVTLINGRWLQLHLAQDGNGRATIATRLVRKHDGCQLADWPHTPTRISHLRPRLARHEHTELNDLLRLRHAGDRPYSLNTRLAWTTSDAEAALRRLNLPAAVADRQRLPLYPEPAILVSCGSDLAGRNLYLTSAAAGAWRRMRTAAHNESITLLAVSGFRSLDYQAGLVARKLARGMAVDDILRYSALPGRSEHHLGTVVDLHDGNGPALEEPFEDSAAFAWLLANAERFGFRLSYPRDNAWAIGYEPWHWRYTPGSAPA